MSVSKDAKVWMNGKLVDWENAKIHILSHVIHYGSCIFEGQRCYNTKNGTAALCLKEHVDRFFNSTKIYRMDIPFSKEEITEAILETVRVNKMKECYIRPIAYRGFGTFGVNPFGSPIDIAIAVWEWGQYLGEGALENGVDVKVSTWTRMAPNTFPALAKSAANYMNSQLIKMEAILEGYTEGIALDVAGYVSEGSGENLFIIQEGVLCTPPLGASVLPGITRKCIITLANDLGYEVKETIIPREALYLADEVFFTGSAAEISPIRSIDKIKIGEGKRGPITKHLQEEYFAILHGEKEDKFNWLTYVYK